MIIEKNRALVLYAVTTFCWMILLFVGVVAMVVFSQMVIIKKTTKPIIELCEVLQNPPVDENLF